MEDQDYIGSSLEALHSINLERINGSSPVDKKLKIIYENQERILLAIKLSADARDDINTWVKELPKLAMEFAKKHVGPSQTIHGYEVSMDLDQIAKMLTRFVKEITQTE